MFGWTLTLTLVCFYLTRYTICEHSQLYREHKHWDQGVFSRHQIQEEPSGKALEDICDCDAIEIVTTKVGRIKQKHSL